MESTAAASADGAERGGASRRRYELTVVIVALLIYGISCISPPNLMDDVDAVQAQIARNMLESGDWVTARLHGIAYLEKSPLKYWLMAISYRVFGVHDWAARIPLAMSVVALCWLTARIGAWAFSPKAGCYAGLALAGSVGLWLFTRIQIPDAMLTLCMTLALWSLLRALDDREPRPRLWAAVMAASIAAGLLLKGLIAALFPCAAAFFYLAITRQLFLRRTWQRLRPFSGALVVFLISAPWHVLATLRNPPYFDLTMKSEAGQYHGFFWFYFLNEHLFRFLNMRHPRDYNTVPRLLFWLLHLIWLFPFSVFLPAAARLGFRPLGRGGHARMLALCWIVFILLFFTFSTTQEYYSMPAYPAIALLLGCAMAEGGPWIRAGVRTVAAMAGAAAAVVTALLAAVWSTPAPGDIARALTQNPQAYTLSLGHMGDLTLASFAYLKAPLTIAGIALLAGAIGAWRFRGERAFLALAVMMVLFFQAARTALIAFDPYLGSRELAEALKASPPGRLIVDNQYYTFSSVFFYAPERTRGALLLNGRVNNLEYGSYAPGAPDVFIDDREFQSLWAGAGRFYLIAEKPAVPRLRDLAGDARLHLLKESGGKFLFVNHAHSN